MTIEEIMRDLGYDITDRVDRDLWGDLPLDSKRVHTGNGAILVYDTSAISTGFVLHLSAPARIADGRDLDVAFFPDGRLARALHGDEIIVDTREALSRWKKARANRTPARLEAAS